uniref:Glyco_hydro_cc domain-containing protein n=1 Tax=Panagrellus redivivus TaxID=6233 RepID=A0A7E4VS77_PANRE
MPARATSVFLSLFIVLLALFTIVAAQNFGARDPFAYMNRVPYGVNNDPWGNGGTWSTWQDAIVLHALGR